MNNQKVSTNNLSDT